MRALPLTLLPLLVAASLAAQTPPPSRGDSQPPAVLAPRRSAFFDLAAQFGDDQQHFGIEPLVFGRVTVGLDIEHSRNTSGPLLPPIGYTVTPGGATSPGTMCAWPGCPAPLPGSSYTAWSFDLGVRWYPAALSMSNADRRMMVYVGEFIGYQWRSLSDAYYGPVPMTQFVYCPAPVQPGIVPPASCPPVYPPVVHESRSLTGWEPGVELGVRLRPLEPLFIDVGGWFKLVTVDDPTRSVRPGQVDARLVAAIGVGW